MSKQPESVKLSIGATAVICERVEMNYYAGNFALFTDFCEGPLQHVSFHVEVIPVKKSYAHNGVAAKNFVYENRLEAWYLVNHEGEQPTLMTIPGLGKCFIHVEVFAK